MAVALPEETFEFEGRKWHRIPAKPEHRFVVGVDLGQSQDFTAIAVLHHTRVPLDTWNPDEATGKLRQEVEERFDVRHLQRLPLGSPYPQQVTRVQELLWRAPLHGEAELVVDQTGVGAPVADLFEAAGLKPLRVTFTAGHEATGRGRKFGVPKSLIVSGLDARLHCGELRFAKELLEAEALRDELQNFQRHVSQTGKLLFEHRSGKHDDLIFAIGIALWAAMRARRGVTVGTVRGLNY